MTRLAYPIRCTVAAQSKWGSNMLILYDVPSSIHGAKTRIILRRKRLDWSEGDSADIQGEAAGVPSSFMPVLVDDALEVRQSRAIAEYLEETYRSPSMLPDDRRARAKARELSDFLDTRLVPAVSALAAGHAGAQLGDAVTAELGTLAALVDRRGYKRRGGDRSLSLRSTSIPLLLGDCGYPAACAWIEALSEARGLAIVVPGAVRAYLDMLEEIDAVAQTMASCRVALRDWITAQYVS